MSKKPNLYIQRVERDTTKLDELVGTTAFDKSFDEYKTFLGPNLVKMEIREATEHEARILS
jgi:hypothetical protein